MRVFSHLSFTDRLKIERIAAMSAEAMRIKTACSAGRFPKEPTFHGFLYPYFRTWKTG